MAGMGEEHQLLSYEEQLTKLDIPGTVKNLLQSRESIAAALRADQDGTEGGFSPVLSSMPFNTVLAVLEKIMRLDMFEYNEDVTDAVCDVLKIKLTKVKAEEGLDGVEASIDQITRIEKDWTWRDGLLEYAEKLLKADNDSSSGRSGLETGGTAVLGEAWFARTDDRQCLDDDQAAKK